MRFTAICALAVEIHCDLGHDASITAIAMPRCGELRFPGPLGPGAQKVENGVEKEST